MPSVFLFNCTSINIILQKNLISKRKQNIQKTMVEALKTDSNVKTLKASATDIEHQKKTRSSSLNPGNLFQSDRLSSTNIRRKKYAQNNKDKNPRAKVVKGSLDRSHVNNKTSLDTTTSEERNFNAMQHTSVDIHEDNEDECGSLLSNPHHHHHVHLPKVSISPPEIKVINHDLSNQNNLSKSIY